MKDLFFGFVSKLVKRKEIKQSQKAVMKYVNMLGDGPDVVTYDCPYCVMKLEAWKVEKVPEGETKRKAPTIFTTGDVDDFVQHVVKEHHRDPIVAKTLAEMMYIQAGLKGLQ